jgi:hypothetical protein
MSLRKAVGELREDRPCKILVRRALTDQADVYFSRCARQENQPRCAIGGIYDIFKDDIGIQALTAGNVILAGIEAQRRIPTEKFVAVVHRNCQNIKYFQQLENSGQLIHNYLTDHPLTPEGPFGKEIVSCTEKSPVGESMPDPQFWDLTLDLLMGRKINDLDLYAYSNASVSPDFFSNINDKRMRQVTQRALLIMGTLYQTTYVSPREACRKAHDYMRKMHEKIEQSSSRKPTLSSTFI